MYLTTTGSQNVAIGYNTVSEPTVLNDFNVYVGSKSGQNAATRGYGTLALGYGTMTGGTNSNSNIVIGYNAQIPYSEDHFMNIGDIIYARKGDGGTGGRDTVMIGAASYTQSYTPDFTVGVVGALSATGAIHSTDYIKFPNGSNVHSTYIGYQSGSGTTADRLNVGVGYQTLTSLNGSGALGNNAIGNGALDSLTSGDSNDALGQGAMAGMISGSNNISIGRDSMGSNTTGSGNVAIGTNALINGGNEPNNIAIGYDALANAGVGSNNIAIGKSTGDGGGSNGHFNVLVGGSAGPNMSGRGVVALGHGAATGTSATNDVIAIGYNAQPPGGSDYTMNIGDIIYGGQGSVAGNRKAVGINVIQPLTALDVKYENVASLAANRGGGSDIITFGNAGTGYADFILHQLRGASNWVPADANYTTMQGNLLGIAMGGGPDEGVLLKGYYNITLADDVTTWANGGPVYISTTAGKITEVAPTCITCCVRVVGYMTDTNNVIYFNPSTDFLTV